MSANLRQVPLGFDASSVRQIGDVVNTIVDDPRTRRQQITGITTLNTVTSLRIPHQLQRVPVGYVVTRVVTATAAGTLVWIAWDEQSITLRPRGFGTTFTFDLEVW